MKAYILSIVLVALIGAVVSILSPDGEGGGIGKHARFAVGLVLITVCLAPVFSLPSLMSKLGEELILPEESTPSVEYESIFQSQYLAAELENTKEGIAMLLHDRFGIEPSDVKISIRLSEEERRPEQILVTLYGRAIWSDTQAIESYLEELLGCAVVTAVG